MEAKEAYNILNKQQGNYFSVYGRNPQTFGIKESPFERLARMKMELEEFKKDLKFIEERNKEVKNEIAEDDLAVLNEIESLQNEFTQLTSNQFLRDFGGENNSTLSKFSLESNLTLLK